MKLLPQQRERVSFLGEPCPVSQGTSSHGLGLLALRQGEGLAHPDDCLRIAKRKLKIFSCFWEGIFAPGDALQQPEPSGKASAHRPPQVHTRFLAQPLLPVLQAKKVIFCFNFFSFLFSSSLWDY